MFSIFAPWRKAFIEGKKKESSCIFCTRTASDPSLESLVVHKDKNTFIVLNKYPYNNGHLMIAPYKHVADFSLLTEEESAELARNIQRSIEVLKKAYNPQGFNIGMNLGSTAGAGVADHMHWHVVPRWGGDTNFMPVVGQTKVLHEILSDTFEKVFPLFRDIR